LGNGRSLPDTLGEDIELFKICLPVDQQIAPNNLLLQLHQHKPDVVLCFGLASGRSRFCLERVAINLMDFQIPDNVGVKISEAPINENGPTAYFTNLPINDLLSILLSANIPARISLTAGAFLCNLVFYRLMHEIETCQLSTKAGFFHLPLQPDQAIDSNKPSNSLSLEKVIQAVLLIIKLLYQYHSSG